MSVFIKKSKLRVKNEDGTSYTGVMNAVAEESTEELIKQIEAKGEEVVAKGKKTLESIPEDYTVLEETVGELKEDKVDNSDIIYNLSAMLEPFIQKQEITGTWDENYTGYIDKLNGNAVSYDQMRMISLQVKEHEIYDIKSRVGYRMTLWSIHDSSGNIIKLWKNSDISLLFDYYEDIGVAIPKSGVELRVYAYVGHLHSYIRRYIAKFYVDSPLKGKKWCAIGDSLTDSATLNGDKNYVDFITDETGVISVNKGIGGTGYLNNNNGADTTFYERHSDFPKDADIYTFFGSFNDMNLFDDNSIGNIESNDLLVILMKMQLLGLFYQHHGHHIMAQHYQKV